MMSGGGAASGLAFALSSLSGAMGETCCESVGGRARGEPGVKEGRDRLLFEHLCVGVHDVVLMRCYCKTE